jgi:hypothetical protein
MIVAYGMTTIMVYGSIFNGVRNSIHELGSDEGSKITRPIFNFISELIKCMLCTSTWVGFFLSLTFFSPAVYFIGHTGFFSVFFDGMLSAGSVWAINSIIEWFEENRPQKVDTYVETEEKEILND